MAHTYEYWDYGERITSAGLNKVSSNGIPRFTTITERDTNYLGAAPGAMCWVENVSTVPRPTLFQARTHSDPSGYKWIPYGSPLLVARRAVTQSLATGTAAAITFDTVDVDPLGTMTTPSSTFTIPATGYYSIIGRVGFAPNATGIRTAAILNATFSSFVDGNAIGAVAGSEVTVYISTPPRYFTSGTNISMTGYQNSGGALKHVSGERILWPFPTSFRLVGERGREARLACRCST